jgi:Holliday junction DNA helicase RuvA
MIGRLRGVLVEKRAPWLVVELTNGLGYEIEAPMSTFYRLPELGQSVTLYTHLTVREDAHLLFGFSDARERALFRALIKVNGVGPKLALTILSSFEPQAFVLCINHGDAASLSRVPGIGKKTAERLIIEMRDRLVDPFALEQGNEALLPAIHSTTSTPTINSPLQEAISALVALGYKPQEASKAIAQIDTADLSCENIIRQALQRVMA